MKTVLVTAADANYFELLMGLVESFRALPHNPNLDFCLLDVGLTPQQVEHAEGLFAQIVKPGWDLDFAAQNKAPPWFRAMVSRPHLPKHFPNYDLIAWVDADTWFCDAVGLNLALHGASVGELCIVPELDRAYDLSFGRRPSAAEFMFACYEQGWDSETAKKFHALPPLNTGFFAMRRDHPAWEIWSRQLKEALQRAVFPAIEQCALNAIIYRGEIKAHLLPAWCNWKCTEAMPALDVQSRRLHCPMLPHETISLCHLIAIKQNPVRVYCSDGVQREMPLTWQSVHRTQLPHPAPANAS